MKKIKIGLVILAGMAIAFYSIRSYIPKEKVKEVALTGNPFLGKIEQEMDSLGNLPDNKFSKDFQEQINYLIDDYYTNGRLGENQSENTQRKEILLSNLYSVYVEKFIEQAFYVFNRSEWGFSDLRFIRSEYQELQNSPMLETDSPINKKLDEIQRIFRQYDILVRFISQTKDFSFAETSLSSRYPLADAITKLNQARRYRISGLGNSYVNNCTRLHNELENLPNILFRVHVSYLDNKIDYWSGMYSNYNSQKTYADKLFTPLVDEIEALDNDIYNTTLFSGEYSRLKEKWQDDARKAYEHFSEIKSSSE